MKAVAALAVALAVLIPSPASAAQPFSAYAGVSTSPPAATNGYTATLTLHPVAWTGGQWQRATVWLMADNLAGAYVQVGLWADSTGTISTYIESGDGAGRVDQRLPTPAAYDQPVNVTLSCDLGTHMWHEWFGNVMAGTDTMPFACAQPDLRWSQDVELTEYQPSPFTATGTVTGSAFVTDGAYAPFGGGTFTAADG